MQNGAEFTDHVKDAWGQKTDQFFCASKEVCFILNKGIGLNSVATFSSSGLFRANKCEVHVCADMLIVPFFFTGSVNVYEELWEQTPELLSRSSEF